MVATPRVLGSVPSNVSKVPGVIARGSQRMYWSDSQVLSEFDFVDAVTLSKRKNLGEPVYGSSYVAFHQGGESWYVYDLSLEPVLRTLRVAPISTPETGKQKGLVEEVGSNTSDYWKGDSFRQLFRTVPEDALRKKMTSQRDLPVYDRSDVAFYIGGQRPDDYWVVFRLSFDYFGSRKLVAKQLRLSSSNSR